MLIQSDIYLMIIILGFCIGECWTMLLVALSGTAAVRPRIWQFAAERLFKLKVSRYVQYVQMCLDVFSGIRCSGRWSSLFVLFSLSPLV